VTEIVAAVLVGHEAQCVIFGNILGVEVQEIYRGCWFSADDFHVAEHVLLTCDQRVGMVASYSYRVIVKPA